VDCIHKPYHARLIKMRIKTQLKIINQTRTIEKYSHSLQNPPAGYISMQLPYARVLVVDDVEINLEVLKGMMHPYGMFIDCATSGPAAIAAIRNGEHLYNAIFMDYIMPEMDGLETVKVIREEIGSAYAKTVPIIALTADTTANNDELFLNNGFQAFITKPIESARLDAILEKWVRNKDLEKTFTDEQGKTLSLKQNRRSGNERRSGKDRRSGIDRRNNRDLWRLHTSEIDGLDIQKGRERFGGNIGIYLQVLRSFTSNTWSLMETIKEVNAGNLKNYAITVHGIKGACWGIWAEAAGELAGALEKAAKAGELDFVTANNETFINTLTKLLVDIEDIIGKKPPVQDKPKKDKIGREALTKLLAACENYNITEAEAVFKEIENFDYEADGGLTLWLRENINQMNFLEIIELLTRFLRQHND